MAVAARLLDFSRIGGERLCLRWVSAAEGQLFAEYVSEYTERVRRLGPFDPERFLLPLAAVESALASPRLRWLTGTEMRITRKENVYGQKLDVEGYNRLLRSAAEEEYEKALVLESLREGPRSVRDIALKSGLPVYTVSLRLGELERARLARFCEYEGRTPMFTAAA
jgi:hypothetical protein